MTYRYRAVLLSSRWQALKWRVLLRNGFRCDNCGRRYHGPRLRAVRFFDLHHRHYRTVGCESFEDVMALCRVCHRAEHGVVA